MRSADVVVVGGGIAGLSAAWALARAGRRGVVLLEREELFASHSSGRNAAIFRHLDASPGGVELAVRSRELLDPLMASRGGWLHRCGALYLGRDALALDKLLQLARRHDLAHELVERPQLESRLPLLKGGAAALGLFVPDDGVVDIHGVCSALADEARAAGATLCTRSEVTGVRVAGGRIEGVELGGGESLGAPEVVIAAGAWSSGLGQAAGAPLVLTPMRRHVAQLDAGPSPEAPIAWCVDDEAYFRAESGGALASPCDEDEFEPCLPPEAPHARELLAEKLARLAPALSESGVRRGWACLRTFARDRAMVVGADPRARGLWWIAGLGGHGITAGVAVGELLSQAMSGAHSALGDALAPGRLL